MNHLKYIVVLLIAVNVSAQNISESAGTYSGLFLRFPVSPKASALAESYTAMTQDVTALYYNPAALARMTGSGIVLNHTQWFEDIRFDNIAFGYKATPKLGIGLGFSYLWMPEIVGRDIDGMETGDKLSVSTGILNVSAGYKIHPAFYLGLGMKYFNDQLAGYSATGVAFDLGLFMYTALQGLSVGFSAQNLGGEIQYDVEKEKLPYTLRFGAAYKIPEQDLRLALDMTKSADENLAVNLGAEYVYREQFALRAGNCFQEGKLLIPAFGLGFALQNRYALDYGIHFFEDLGAVHQIGLSFLLNLPYVSGGKTPVSLDDKFAILVPPADVKFKIEGEILTITWGEVTGVQYNVYARTGEEGKWVKLNKAPLDDNRMELKAGKTQATFYVTVTSVRNNKESSYAKEVKIDAN